MKYIKKFEKKGEYNMNLYHAYMDTLRARAEHLNFHDVIWESDIPDLIKLCIEEKIDRITISSRFSSLIDRLWILEQHGAKILGTIIVPMSYNKICSDERDTAPALLLDMSNIREVA